MSFDASRSQGCLWWLRADITGGCRTRPGSPGGGKRLENCTGRGCSFVGHPGTVPLALGCAHCCSMLMSLGWGAKGVTAIDMCGNSGRPNSSACNSSLDSASMML